jgi:hypothetical protein
MRTDEPDAATKEEGVWGDIGYPFSKPVAYDEPHLDYIPTQILSEAFRRYGYDGIIYKSLPDEDGKNIALFDLDSAKLLSRCLSKTGIFTVRSAKVECFSTLPSPWPDSIESKFEQVPLY